MIDFRENRVLIAIFVAVLIFLFLPFGPPKNVEAVDENEKTIMHYFYQEGCPNCAQQSEFIEENLVGQYPNLEIREHAVSEEGSKELINELAENYGIEDLRYVTPTTILDGQIIYGFNDDRAKKIIDIIENKQTSKGNVRSIPIIGEVNLKNISLPVLAVVLGSVDGLNICSIGALIMVLLIVLGFDSRKKIFFYGILFIFTVVLVYGLFVFGWYHLLDTIMVYQNLLRYVIGFAGIGGGILFFKQFLEFYKHGPKCSYEDSGYITKARKKVKDSFEGNTGALAISASVIFFASVVTLLELPCSASLPVVFSGVLVESQLPGMLYGVYIGLYLLFYLLIELVIFIGAVITKEVWFGGGKFITWVTLFGSLLLFLMGGLYLL